MYYPVLPSSMRGSVANGPHITRLPGSGGKSKGGGCVPSPCIRKRIFLPGWIRILLRMGLLDLQICIIFCTFFFSDGQIVWNYIHISFTVKNCVHWLKRQSHWPIRVRSCYCLRLCKFLKHEANIRGGGNTVHVVFNICPEAGCRKGWGQRE